MLHQAAVGQALAKARDLPSNLHRHAAIASAVRPKRSCCSINTKPCCCGVACIKSAETAHSLTSRTPIFFRPSGHRVRYASLSNGAVFTSWIVKSGFTTKKFVDNPLLLTGEPKTPQYRRIGVFQSVRDLVHLFEGCFSCVIIRSEMSDPTQIPKIPVLVVRVQPDRQFHTLNGLGRVAAIDHWVNGICQDEC